MAGLAFLKPEPWARQSPPDVEKQLQAARFLLLASSAVLTWDILINLTEDYEIFVNKPFQIAAAAYLVSRITSAAFVLGFVVFAAYPGIHNCQTFIILLSSLVPFANGSISLIFFIRVRAAYDARRLITFLFGFLWLCVVGSGIVTSASGLQAESLNGMCVTTELPGTVTIPVIMLTVHDTSIFVAMSYRLLANTYDYEQYAGSRWRKLRVMVHGGNMPTFSKTLFRDGQYYYLIAAVTNLLTITMIYAPVGPTFLHGLLAIPNLALTSIMAGRVYRNVKLHTARLPELELSGLPRLSLDEDSRDVVAPSLGTTLSAFLSPSPSPSCISSSSPSALVDSPLATRTMMCWTANVFLAALLIAHPIAAFVLGPGSDRDQVVMQMRTPSDKASLPSLVLTPTKLYRFVNPDTERSRYSFVGGAEDDDEYDGVVARVFDEASPSTPTTRDVFYTRDDPLYPLSTPPNLKLHAYVDMGAAAYVFPMCGGVPLFRLVKEGDNHFYTADKEEREMMLWNEGFEDAGIVGYVITN
ncbi:hypothetical protein C8R45DRAFT_1211284 [Mycena sanguinolenta]|nr:hypothetical protein C8R45DRAFT_1211284 [Mycena sanguinolenta]